jgi:hypothetical protein
MLALDFRTRRVSIDLMMLCPPAGAPVALLSANALSHVDSAPAQKAKAIVDALHTKQARPVSHHEALGFAFGGGCVERRLSAAWLRHPCFIPHIMATDCLLIIRAAAAVAAAVQCTKSHVFLHWQFCCLPCRSSMHLGNLLDHQVAANSATSGLEVQCVAVCISVACKDMASQRGR